MKTRYPSPLPAKATIGIISPSSPQRDERRLHRGIRYLESLGHTVILGAHALKHDGAYLAGSDEERRADLVAMFSDPRVDAIFCARGGYGSARLIDGFDWSVVRRHPKIFVGFSDTTAFQLALLRHTGLITFSGALPSVDMADGMQPATEEWFWRALSSTRPLGTIKQPWPLQSLQRGRAEGQLVGGNLSVLMSLVGTRHLPSLRDAILVIEDVGEETYRIDRMLTQLAMAGVLGSIAGMITGQWSQGARPRGTTPHRDVHDMLREMASQIQGPILTDLMYGHEALKLTLPIGVRVRLSTRSNTMSFLEAATQ